VQQQNNCGRQTSRTSTCSPLPCGLHRHVSEWPLMPAPEVKGFALRLRRHASWDSDDHSCAWQAGTVVVFAPERYLLGLCCHSAIISVHTSSVVDTGRAQPAL
jgi:hypothetical protein